MATHGKLTKQERAAQDAFVAKLAFTERKTARPVVIALIGLVGSGKSSVAQELAKRIGATVVVGDDIRIELRRQDASYEHASRIAGNAAREIVRKGGNVILDSDFIDTKRASLREKLRGTGVRLLFIRTHCDRDVMLGRMMTATYRNQIDDFFGGASAAWKGNAQTKGAVVKIREMWRRTPHHYRWENEAGGRWVLRKLPFTVFAEIDTTDEAVWKREVKKCAERILSQ